MEIVLNIFAVVVQMAINIYTVLFLAKLFKKDSFSKKNIILVVAISAFSIFACSAVKVILPLFNTLLALSLLFVTFYFIMRLNFVKSTLLVVFDFICTTLSELAGFTLATVLFNKSFDNLMTDYLATSFVLIIEILTIILFTNILRIMLKKFTKLNLLINTITTKQLLNFILLIIICICPQLILFVIQKYSFPLYFLIINCIQVIIISIVLFVYVNKSLEKDKAETDLIATRLHNETMSGMVDGLKTLKHDFNNIIQTLSGYSKAKEYKELDEYIDKLLKEFKVVNTLGTIDPEIFNEPGIYGIVGAKYFLITNDDITMDIEVFTNIKEINFPMPELARILGILLDNAYEATKKAKNPYVRLEMKYDNRKCADIIRVINTYDTNITIDLEKIYKKGFSSKKVKSGIGLWEVKKLVSKISNSQVYANIENDKFIQNIIIEK